MGHNSSLAAVYTNMLCNDDLWYVDIEVLNFLYICILDIYCTYIRYTADAAMTTFAFDPIKSNPSIATNLETLQTHAVV